MKQLTVFIENRVGRLAEVTDILTENNINIICLSLADTSDYGMLRMMVSQPAAACDVLSASGFPAMLTDVIAVRLPHHFGQLKKLCGMLSGEGVDISYLYALTSGDNAAIVLKTSDNDKAEAVLSKEYTLMSAVEVYNL